MTTNTIDETQLRQTGTNRKTNEPIVEVDVYDQFGYSSYRYLTAQEAVGAVAAFVRDGYLTPGDVTVANLARTTLTEYREGE